MKRILVTAVILVLGFVFLCSYNPMIETNKKVISFFDPISPQWEDKIDPETKEETPALIETSRNEPQGVAVLVFHEITPEKGNPAIISVDEFEYIISTLLEGYGYTFINLNLFHSFLKGEVILPPSSILVTFDDGYEGVYKYAHPILLKYNVPAVMFPVAKWFSPYPRPEPHRPHLTTQEAREMILSGLWSFGGHSYDGHMEITTSTNTKGKFLTAKMLLLGNRLEDDGEYKARVWSDIMLMTYELQKLGINKPVDFAPPYGEITPALRVLLSEAGYQYIYVQGKSLNFPGAKDIYRITVKSVQVVMEVHDLRGN